MKWETFPHEADVGVRGIGATVAEAFAAAALAMTAVITVPERVAAREAVPLEVSAPDVELLLFDWLNALIFAMSTRKMLFSRFDVHIENDRLTATAWGEPIDPVRHQPAAEIKGASFCELRVARLADGQWLAQCVVDV